LIFCCEHDVADSRHGFFGRQNSAAYIIFLASYLVFALGKFPGLKIDRPGAAIIGAVAMFAAQIVHPAEALRFIDFATLVLLFSMMLIVGHLHLTGFFEWNAELGCAICAPHTCCRR
jgi:Na+/H+ antiporter NhaD/arsenite permease-like protein